jgi:O-methyltransferase
MIRTIKTCILRIIARFGYSIVKLPAAPAHEPAAPAEKPKYSVPADLVAALPEIIRRLHPADQPPLDGYQLEMATYHLKTGMGDVEPEFFPLYERCREYTMTSWERLYSLYSVVRYLVKANVPGDFLECGVWRGGSMMMVALTLLSMGRTDRRLLLFDTFEGLPKPDETLDVDVWGNRGIDGWRPHRKTDQSSDWAYASLEEVRANMEGTGYPMSRVSFVKGMVEDTLPANAPETIAMLRLDTDWYSSTRHEMEHLYPRLSRNGVLILDDYGHFQGARKATDEYFETVRTPPLLTRVDYAGRIAVKMA